MTQRKIRKDILVKNLEKKLGIGNAILNPDGKNARGDKKIENLQKDFQKAANK